MDYCCLCFTTKRLLSIFEGINLLYRNYIKIIIEKCSNIEIKTTDRSTKICTRCCKRKLDSFRKASVFPYVGILETIYKEVPSILDWLDRKAEKSKKDFYYGHMDSSPSSENTYFTQRGFLGDNNCFSYEKASVKNLYEMNTVFSSPLNYNCLTTNGGNHFFKFNINMSENINNQNNYLVEKLKHNEDNLNLSNRTQNVCNLRPNIVIQNQNKLDMYFYNSARKQNPDNFKQIENKSAFNSKNKQFYKTLKYCGNSKSDDKNKVIKSPVVKSNKKVECSDKLLEIWNLSSNKKELKEKIIQLKRRVIEKVFNDSILNSKNKDRKKIKILKTCEINNNLEFKTSQKHDLNFLKNTNSKEVESVVSKKQRFNSDEVQNISSNANIGSLELKTTPLNELKNISKKSTNIEKCDSNTNNMIINNSDTSDEKVGDVNQHNSLFLVQSKSQLVYTCKLCERIFSSNYALERHGRKHLFCKYCKLKFRTKKLFMSHMCRSRNTCTVKLENIALSTKIRQTYFKTFEHMNIPSIDNLKWISNDVPFQIIKTESVETSENECVESNHLPFVIKQEPELSDEESVVAQEIEMDNSMYVINVNIKQEPSDIIEGELDNIKEGENADKNSENQEVPQNEKKILDLHLFEEDGCQRLIPNSDLATVVLNTGEKDNESEKLELDTKKTESKKSACQPSEMVKTFNVTKKIHWRKTKNYKNRIRYDSIRCDISGSNLRHGINFTSIPNLNLFNPT